MTGHCSRRRLCLWVHMFDTVHLKPSMIRLYFLHVGCMQIFKLKLESIAAVVIKVLSMSFDTRLPVVTPDAT